MRIQCAHLNIPIIKDRLLFSILKSNPRSSSTTFYFTIENEPEYQYQPFFEDFGPPSLPQLYKFTSYVESLLQERKEKILHFYSTPAPAAKSNLSLYISFFRMIHFNYTAKEAFKPLENIAGQLRPFRDASSAKSLFDLSVYDVLKGIQKAIDNKWFVYSKFDLEKWLFLQKLENGNMTWIIPGKLLAFASPYSFDALPGRPEVKVATAQTVISIFQREDMKINNVIRLSKKFYDEKEFIDAGIKHTELYFPDGSIPPDRVIEKFFDILDEEGSVVAVHCKAGLGRAGTLCGCYLKREYDFTGREALGYLRLCRPGSVIGSQQQFLMRYFNPDEGYTPIPSPATPTTINNNNNNNNIGISFKSATGNMNGTSGSGSKSCNFVFSRNYSNTGNYKNISLGGTGSSIVSQNNSGFPQESNLPPEYEPPVKKMFSNPSKGFKLDTVNVADYYCNNPKYVDFVGAMPPQVAQTTTSNVPKIAVQPPVQPMTARSARGRNAGCYTISDNYNNRNNSSRRGYTSTPRQPPPTKLWTQPKEKLPPVITMPLNSSPHQQHRRYNKPM